MLAAVNKPSLLPAAPTPLQMPSAWITGSRFVAPFTAAVRPGNEALCGFLPVTPAAGYTVLFDPSFNATTGAGSAHPLVTTLGNCNYCSCRQGTVNAQAPNLFDTAW